MGNLKKAETDLQAVAREKGAVKKGCQGSLDWMRLGPCIMPRAQTFFLTTGPLIV
jgi:hypothetical protein